jgi:hypothetical protein
MLVNENTLQKKIGIYSMGPNLVATFISVHENYWEVKKWILRRQEEKDKDSEMHRKKRNVHW